MEDAMEDAEGTLEISGVVDNHLVNARDLEINLAREISKQCCEDMPTAVSGVDTSQSAGVRKSMCNAQVMHPSALNMLQDMHLNMHLALNMLNCNLRVWENSKKRET